MSGSPSVIIDLSEQKAYFYKGGQVAGVSALSTGEPKHPTKTGTFKIMEKDWLACGNTAKHPIEVVPVLGGTVPSQGVEGFDIMTSICLWVVQRGYFNGPLSDAGKATLQPLAKVVLSVMHIRSTVSMSR
jgi:hypothetical protein